MNCTTELQRMRRYGFITKNDYFEALNRLRDAFLAAKDGSEVNEIINGILTDDEKIKIGRRILVARALKNDNTYSDITSLSNVGRTTITWVAKQLRSYPKCFELIFKRSVKLEKEYERKKYRLVGGSQLVFKKREYTGIKRKDIKR